MYGLLLENLAEYVKTVFGDEKWDEIRRKADIATISFGVHDDYDENLLMKIASIAQEVSIVKFIYVQKTKENDEREKVGKFMSFLPPFGLPASLDFNFARIANLFSIT